MVLPTPLSLRGDKGAAIGIRGHGASSRASVVPTNIVLHALPSEVGVKVSQVRSHMFFIKDDNNAIVLVSPTDRRIADVVR
jgi:hypothetical protein